MDVGGPLQVRGPVVAEPLEDLRCGPRPAIAVALEVGEEVALTKDAHTDRPMRHALVLSEGVHQP